MSIPANATQFVQIQSPAIPLGAAWDLKMRGIGTTINSADTAGQLQLLAIRAFWAFADLNSNIMGGLDVITDGVVTPNWVLPSNAFGMFGDPKQEVTSFDLGFPRTPATITAFMNAEVHNADATNPHIVQLAFNAFIEIIP